MGLQAIIFDLDGTLLNTLDDLTAAVCHALGAFGLSAPDVSRVRKYVGNGVPKLIERAVYFATNGKDPEPNDSEVDRSLVNACLAVFTEYYNAHSMDMTAPYPGISEMLAAVRGAGLKSAIVTNKYDSAANALRERFFGTVDVAVGLQQGISPKPAPDGVYKALELIGADRSRAVYVGDGETDIATAKRCGMPVVAVTWGFRDAELLKTLEPDYIIDSPDALLGVLRSAGLLRTAD